MGVTDGRGHVIYQASIPIEGASLPVRHDFCEHRRRRHGGLAAVIHYVHLRERARGQVTPFASASTVTAKVGVNHSAPPMMTMIKFAPSA